MALPVSVPYAFANATTTQNLAYLDSNFNTLSYTLNGIGNGTVSLANVSITGGTISANVSATSIHNGTSNVSVDSANGPVSINTNGSNAMFIDASQNVGIGTTSPSFKFDVAGTGRFTGLTQFDNAINLKTATLNYVYFDDAVAFSRNGVGERMRIDSSGNVGVGTTTPNARLHADSTSFSALATGGSATVGGINFRNTSYTNGFIYYDNGANLTFVTNGVERARIDSSGNLLVGQTTYSSITVGASINPAGLINIAQSSSTSAGTGLQIYSTGAAAYRFYVDMGGTIHATSTSITAISDQSLKTNIRPLETGIAEIMRLKPRRFDWKEETQIGETNVAGFIAQEVQEVLPELVYDYKYTDTETKLGLKMGDMLPTVVKALQESVAKITALEDRITKLESGI